MYIKVSSQNIKASNSRSCGQLVDYLEKENKNKKEKELFFNNNNNDLTAHEVIKNIDGHGSNKGLKNNEPRFYNLIISPSSYELKTITNNEDKIKSYTKDVMEQYAKQFGRSSKDGQPLNSDDFVWFAKLEKHRTFSEKDKLVRHNEKYSAITEEIKSNIGKNLHIEKLEKSLKDMGGVFVLNDQGKIEQTVSSFDKTIIKRGMNRPEEYQSHVHIIVSRFHKHEKMSLSPMANSRGGENALNGKKVGVGFNRNEFAQNCEYMYDIKFDHVRNWDQSLASKIQSNSEQDKYVSQLTTNIIANYSKQKGLNIKGVTQSNSALVHYMGDSGIERGGDVFKKYVEKYYPPAVLESLDRQYEQVKSLKILDITSVDIVAKAIKETGKQITKSLGKSIYI